MITTIYGSKLCADCRNILHLFEQNGIESNFLDITTDLAHLKAFLAIRENNPVFDKARANNKIGIPFFILPDGMETIDEAQALFELVQGGRLS